MIQNSAATSVDVAIARTDLLQKQLEYTGNTTPFRIISVRSQVEARLLALNLDVGDPVKLGQNVGQLDDAILSTQLKQAEAELAALKSEVARATNQVSNARADVERARLEVVQAQADSERQQRLFKAGAIAEQTAQQSRTQAMRAGQEQVRTARSSAAFPLALGIGEGSEFLQPLGIVVFFGMAIATMLTLFIIPCFYILLHDLLGGNWAKPVLSRLRGFTKKFI